MTWDLVGDITRLRDRLIALEKRVALSEERLDIVDAGLRARLKEEADARLSQDVIQPGDYLPEEEPDV